MHFNGLMYARSFDRAARALRLVHESAYAYAYEVFGLCSCVFVSARVGIIQTAKNRIQCVTLISLSRAEYKHSTDREHSLCFFFSFFCFSQFFG